MPCTSARLWGLCVGSRCRLRACHPMSTPCTAGNHVLETCACHMCWLIASRSHHGCIMYGLPVQSWQVKQCLTCLVCSLSSFRVACRNQLRAAGAIPLPVRYDEGLVIAHYTHGCCRHDPQHLPAHTESVRTDKSHHNTPDLLTIDKCGANMPCIGYPAHVKTV